MALNETTSANCNSTADYENDADIPLPTFITWISIASFSLSGIVGIALYIPIFIVIISKREKFLANSFYKFLLTLGVAEVTSLFYCGLFASFCLLRGWQLGTSGYCPVPLLFNYAFGALAWVIWFVEFFVHPLIAFDRLMAICFFSHYPVVLAPKNAIVACVVAWLGACLIAAPIIGDYLPAAYFVGQLGCFFVDTSSDAYINYNWFMVVYEDFVLATCALLYTICCVVLAVRRRRLVAKSSVLGMKSTVNSWSTKAQRKLTVQAAMHFFWLSAYEIMWAAMGDINSIWLLFAMNMVEQIICLNTPLITIWLNDAIREELTGLLCRKGAARQVATVSVITSTKTTKKRWASKRNE